MKNIKYTTTNKCKSKVFLTNFSILLKCSKEKQKTKKFPVWDLWASERYWEENRAKTRESWELGKWWEKKDLRDMKSFFDKTALSLDIVNLLLNMHYGFFIAWTLIDSFSG